MSAEAHGGTPARKRRIVRAKPATGAAAVWARTPLPPAEVLEGAACSPATAQLFEPVTQTELRGGAWAETQRRLQGAYAICAGCPVKAACDRDAIAHDRVGVFGGRYHSQVSKKRRQK